MVIMEMEDGIGGTVHVCDKSEARGNASVTMGRLVEDNGDHVQGFFNGTKNVDSKTSRNSLPVKREVYGIKGNGGSIKPILGKDSSSFLDYES
jgi:hypothetical protein